MALGNKVGVKGDRWRMNKQRGKHSDESDEEYKVGEDDDCDESDGFVSLDSDESDEEEVLKRVSKARTTRKMSSVRKRNETNKPRKRRRVSYTDMDDDDEEYEDEDEGAFLSWGRKRNQIRESQEKKKVSYIEEDDEDEDEDKDEDKDDLEFMSFSRKGNQVRKSRQYRISSTEEDDDDYETKEEKESDDDSKYISETKEKASYTEEADEDDVEFMTSSRTQNLIKTPQEKVSVSYTEEDDHDDDDDDAEEDKNDKEFVLSENEFDDDDDAKFMTSSMKENLIKKPQEKESVLYREEEDDDAEEDNDDKEFVLSESDFVDDDDEELKMMKNEKESMYSLHKKSRKQRILKKPTRPKPRNQRSKRKISPKDRQVSRKHSANRRNKRRVKTESDSDFVSSVSSDHEYTISEEEREQMREAKLYCEDLRAKMRNSSSRIQEEPTFEQRKPRVQKGKEKVEDIKEEIGKQVCGICLSEEGKRTVKGVLNCCLHHFCFSCIIEWSKVESRCPLCKQRFSTITKAARSNTVFNSRTVIIPIPERDQIYQPSEEEVRGYLDPYESVICTECNNGGDDAFMLLCDICDSPAHTFCVGLGEEVPEGNWYCNGCKPTIFTSLNASDIPTPVSGGFDLNQAYAPEIPSTQETHVSPEHTATTLRDRRRIHHQIHHRFLNNNRLSDLIGRPSGASTSSSGGIRLFGSHLDQARDLSPRERITHDGSVQGEVGGSGVGFDSRFGYSQLHLCTNRSSIGSDASPSPCREAMGSSRTPQSGFHTPF